MARKRLRRESVGLFDVPDRGDEDDGIAIFGGPASDSEVLGGPSHSSGLFDAPDRGPGVPGLFDRPNRPADEAAGGGGKPARPYGGGLFDKPAPRRKGTG
jgi:hypothetical protein